MVLKVHLIITVGVQTVFVRVMNLPVVTHMFLMGGVLQVEHIAVMFVITDIAVAKVPLRLDSILKRTGVINA
jgi:hypothetical protein